MSVSPIWDRLFKLTTSLVNANITNFSTPICLLEESEFFGQWKDSLILIPMQTVFVGGYTVFTLSVRTNERKCVRDVLFP